jgi:cell volume regulation protein A
MDITLTVTYFAILLGLGVLIANKLKKSNIPDAIFLILLGLILGPTVFANPAIKQVINLTLVDVSVMGAVPDFLRILALILIVFTGTFGLSYKAFKRFSEPSVNLAIGGVLLNTAVLGIVAHFILNLDWIYSFLLAAILSGTSSEVIFPLAKIFKNSKGALTILKMESIFNSPLVVILPTLFLTFIVPGALLNPLQYANQFWQMIAAGIGTGLIIGFAAAKLLKGMLREYTPLLLFAIALITFALAENIGGSGMLAVAVAGLISGNIVFPEKQEVKAFDDHLSEMLRISVFTLLGAQIIFSLSLTQIGTVLLFFAIILLFRPVMISLILRKNFKNMPTDEKVVLSFVAPKGLTAAAIAPIVTSIVSIAQPELANNIINIVFLIIILSIAASTAIAKAISK